MHSRIVTGCHIIIQLEATSQNRSFRVSVTSNLA